MDTKHDHVIPGKQDGVRLDSRVLEEKLQKAVADGYREIMVQAFGQHGIGGRLWRGGKDTVHIRIEGHPGQRVGAMGFPNTVVEVMNPASDDLGWLNAGAHIIVHGNAANGTANAMSQGKIYVAGNIGARGMTMTKRNPRFDPPELWVLGSAGDYFGEFMAGGIAVICGVDPQNPKDVLGYRPLVGMVGGKVYFRGPHGGYSQNDAKLEPIGEKDWSWLEENLKLFLKRIGRSDLLIELTDPSGWQLLAARLPHEKAVHQRKSMKSFRESVWNRELGKGGLIGDLTEIDRSPIPLITTGALRRHVPVWENRKYLAPCEASCPTGIPVHDRWRLIREGSIDEAADMALSYTPFPAAVCGYLCPNLCMQACTRRAFDLAAVDVAQIGKASLRAGLPALPPLSGKRIAVVGGGPAGISVAWQLRLLGHEAVVYDLSDRLGGKIASVVPETRIPREVVSAELARIRKVIPQVHLQQRITREDIGRLREDFDFLVIATGATKPMMLPIPGEERTVSAFDFLVRAKTGGIKPGKRVVVIGAGNVGCDAATEAHRLGAQEITLIDIQEPASFGKERNAAEAAGAKFRWPCRTQEVTPEGVVLAGGELLPADTVIVSIGDKPDLSYLPEEVAVERGHVAVDGFYRTSVPEIFAIGDAVRPGLLTDAIGAGRKAARAVDEILKGQTPEAEPKQRIDIRRVATEYFDPRITAFESLDQCGSQCASCGACRDCGVCAAVCPESAIRKLEKENGSYEYVVDENRCIGCGFCAGACPCGVWNLIANEPIE